MDDAARAALLDNAKQILKQNDRGSWTVPAGDLYPHQWLWDSCFIAIGLSHIDVSRAQDELRSLLRGQWSNGMLPNIIFSPGDEHRRLRELWRSYVSPFAPHDVATSGVTQPPLLAEAVVRVGQTLKLTERRSWYREMYPAILRYHQWLYAERDPHQEGLVILIHPYESGTDNSPSWTSEMRKHGTPHWVKAIERLHIDGLVNMVRTDTRHIPPGQRISNIEAMTQWSALHRLRRKAYNSEAILARPIFAIEDLGFNSILIRANEHLAKIAKDIGHKLPDDLTERMAKTADALAQLWDENSGQYYSRSFISHKLIEDSSLMTFLPLYSGAITQERADYLIKLLDNPKKFGVRWPVPSVPLDSPYFDPYKYWQGPTWLNTNWLIAEGLKVYGFDAAAKSLIDKSLALAARGGLAEYFNPLDGKPAGAPGFSWSAALVIDWLSR